MTVGFIRIGWNRTQLFHYFQRISPIFKVNIVNAGALCSLVWVRAKSEYHKRHKTREGRKKEQMPIKKNKRNHIQHNNEPTYERQNEWNENDYESNPGPTTTVNEEESFSVSVCCRRGVGQQQHRKGVTCILLLQRRDTSNLIKRRFTCIIINILCMQQQQQQQASEHTAPHLFVLIHVTKHIKSLKTYNFTFMKTLLCDSF